MTINSSLLAALRYVRDSKHPVEHRSATNAEAPHHKTLEGLASRFLVEHKGAGFVITKAGRDAIEAGRVRRSRR